MSPTRRAQMRLSMMFGLLFSLAMGPWFAVQAGFGFAPAQGVATGGAAHDLLDGSTIQDSVADTVTRGSIVYGNSTPKWDELVIGSAGAVLSSDGTDAAWDSIAFAAWDATAGIAPISTTSFATLDTRGGMHCLDFDDTVDEESIFRGTMSPNYTGGTITVHVIWSAQTATTGDVRWAVAFERVLVGTLDTDADSFATEQTVDDTTNAASGVTEDAQITFTGGAQLDSLAAGDRFRLKLRRDGAQAEDTLSGDAEVNAIWMEE